MSIAVADVLHVFGPGARVSVPPLREFQKVACRRLVDAQDAGAKRVVLVSCCGSGKSRMLAEVARYRMAEGRKVAWFSHRVELIQQAQEELSMLGVFPEVLSIQSKTRPDVDYLICDEVHHFASDEWRKVFERYPDAAMASGTATPCRSDGRGLHTIADRMVIAARPQEMIDAGYLVPLEIRRPAKLMPPGKLSARPVDAYLEHAKGRSCLVYSPNLKAAAEHCAEFIAAGIEARIVSGTTPRDERAQTLADLKSGKLPVVVSMATLTEGTNLPIVSCIILARSVGSISLYDQIVMRGMRLHPSKTDCLLLDLTGASWVHGHPTEERLYSLDGTGVRRSVECDLSLDAGRSCRVCGCPVEPETVCPDCGTEPPTPKVPEVALSPLVKYAFMRRQNEEEKLAWLKKQVQVQRAKGFKPGWVYFRFKAVYGENLTSDMLRRAQ